MSKNIIISKLNKDAYRLGLIYDIEATAFTRNNNIIIFNCLKSPKFISLLKDYDESDLITYLVEFLRFNFSYAKGFLLTISSLNTTVKITL